MGLRAVLVGCGAIAEHHVQEVAKTSDASMVAVCDREPLMAEQLASR